VERADRHNGEFSAAKNERNKKGGSPCEKREGPLGGVKQNYGSAPK